MQNGIEICFCLPFLGGTLVCLWHFKGLVTCLQTEARPPSKPQSHPACSTTASSSTVAPTAASVATSTGKLLLEQQAKAMTQNRDVVMHLVRVN